MIVFGLLLKCVWNCQPQNIVLNIGRAIVDSTEKSTKGEKGLREEELFVVSFTSKTPCEEAGKLHATLTYDGGEADFELVDVFVAKFTPQTVEAR